MDISFLEELQRDDVVRKRLAKKIILLSCIGLILAFRATVAAQTASSTATSSSDETGWATASSTDFASSTDPAPMAETPDPDTSSSQDIVSDTTTTEAITTTIPQPTVAVAPTITFDTPDAIQVSAKALEDDYYKKNGKYLQILPGDLLPSYESGSVSEKLGHDLPNNVRVDIYDAPAGPGFQVTFQQDGKEYSVGVGPEVDERSYTREMPQITASTTIDVLTSSSSAQQAAPEEPRIATTTDATSTIQ